MHGVQGAPRSHFIFLLLHSEQLNALPTLAFSPSVELVEFCCKEGVGLMLADSFCIVSLLLLVVVVLLVVLLTPIPRAEAEMGGPMLLLR